MTRGSGRWRSGLLMWAAVLAMVCLLGAMVAGCGDDGSSSGDSSVTTAAASSGSDGSGSDASDEGGAGEALAKKILGTFDELVSKVADVSKDMPEPADLEPRLQDLYDEYVGKMLELNDEYLALRDQGGSEWGAFNSYMGENRGKHVTEKDNTLTEIVKYYNLELGDQDMVELLTDRPVELLDLALSEI